MNEYLRQVYDERRAAAERCRKLVLAAQDAITSKRKASARGAGTYTIAERDADMCALNEAMQQLSRAIESVEEIERELPRLDGDASA